MACLCYHHKSFSHTTHLHHHHRRCQHTPHTSILSVGSEVTGRTVIPIARRTIGTGAREPGEACFATWVSPSVTFSTVK